MQKIGTTIAALALVCAATPMLAGVNDVQRNVSPDGKRATEVITGETARTRASKPRLDEALAKAAERLEARGYNRTDIITVVRAIDVQAETRRSSGISPAGDRYVSEEGEIIFYSWDDGDPGTWEGTIYVEDYSNGAYAVYDAQINISSETELTTVWEETVQTGGGGGPGDYQYMTRNGGAEPVQVASLFGGHAGRHDIQLIQYGSGPVGDWVRCFYTWCRRAATVCRLTGPHWGACSAAGCAAAAIGCYVHVM